MPVPGMAAHECPGESLGGQPVCDLRIFIDVQTVVEVDELVAGRLAKHQRHRQQQEAANGQYQAAVLPLGLRVPRDILQAGRTVVVGTPVARGGTA